MTEEERLELDKRINPGRYRKYGVVELIGDLTGTSTKCEVCGKPYFSAQAAEDCCAEEKERRKHAVSGFGVVPDASAGSSAPASGPYGPSGAYGGSYGNSAMPGPGGPFGGPGWGRGPW